MDFERFFVDLATPLFGYLGPHKVYLFMLVSRRLFLMLFGSASGCLGMEKSSICHESYCKTVFWLKSASSWFQGAFFHDFG